MESEFVKKLKKEIREAELINKVKEEERKIKEKNG